jgi:2,3-bisphosphoglycerate-independent phosphoglycerate mutase
MNHKTYKKIVLIILDGFGIAPPGRGNAISQAKTPGLSEIVSNFPSLALQASGPLVGLPWGEMGNSEVGHLNIGAGRIVGQDLPRITNSIQAGEFFKNEVFLKAIEHTQKNNSSLHIMGMVSPGGVHSLDEHVYALLGMAAEKGQQKVFVHMFTDGRDTEQKIALESIKKLKERMSRIGVGSIATIAGRFYGMDRGGHWYQTALTHEALVNGNGDKAHSAEDAVNNSYGQQIFDEMIKPTVITSADGQPVGKIGDNDAVVFVNFRSDRALQLTQFFVKPDVVPEQFRRQPLQNLFFVTMTEYLKDLPVHVAFPSMDLKNNLAEVLSLNKFTQFHIAESEKYAHVTAFFNCGKSDKWPGEERLIVTSPENAHNYLDHPEMSLGTLIHILVDKIAKENFNFYVANFANPDMVGHTGHLKAATMAVEYVDKALKQLLDICLEQDAALIVTADHGNVEQMINSKSGDIDKDHTTNPVPFLFITRETKFAKPIERDYGILASKVPAGVVSDIAPTILELFGLTKPAEMTGISLLSTIDTVPAKH